MPDGRTVGSRICLAAGAILLVLGVLAGYLNHVLLDGPTFAAKVDAVRRTPPVSQALGRSLTDSVVAAQPDLIALRPLVEALATSTAGSEVLSAPTRAAAASFQRAAVTPNSNAIVLRIADAGAVLTALLLRAVPGTASGPAATASLQLARIGDQSWAASTIRLARFLGLAAWLLPLLALLLLGLGVQLSRRRRRALGVAGLAVLGGTAALGLVLLVAGRVAAGQDDGSVRGTLIAYGWKEFTGPLWWWLGALALLAIAVTAAAGSLLPEYDAPAVARRLGRAAVRRPAAPALQVLRAVAFLLVGAAAVADPLDAARAFGAVAGAGLVLYGLAELARATRDRRVPETPPAAPTRRRTRSVSAGVLALVLVCTGGWVAWAAAGTDPAGPAGPVAGAGRVCDGYAALCERRFTDVSYAATHNSMAVAGQPGWYLGEQGLSILGQLDSGVRALQIDVWPGQARVDGRVATAPGSHAEAEAQARAELGPAVVDAGLRVFDTLADPRTAGPPALFLCHGLCEIGATDFRAAMGDVRAWLDTNPDETLTLIIEAHAPAAEIGADLTATGLAAYAYQPAPDGPWPTLREMITSGHRLVAMQERGGGGPAYPWLLDGYGKYLQETPFTFRSAAEFSCAPNRGPKTAPLFLVNHWLVGFESLVSSARAVNTLEVLGGRVEQCRDERQLPNFVSVNYSDIGAVHEVVRRLNGVG